MYELKKKKLLVFSFADKDGFLNDSEEEIFTKALGMYCRDYLLYCLLLLLQWTTERALRLPRWNRLEITVPVGWALNNNN